MKNFKLSLFLMIILFTSMVVAFTPQDDIDMRYYYDIVNLTNITARDYLCVAGTCYNSFSGSGTMTQVNTDDNYLTGGPITSSGTITFNDTKLNATIDARAVTTLAWASITSKPFNSVDVNDYLNVAIGVLQFNETLLNSTIDARGGSTYDNASPITLTGTTFGLKPCSDSEVLAYNTTFGGWQCQTKASSGGGTVTSVSGDGKYVTGTITTSGTFGFDESNLNTTIDARDSDTTYTGGNALTLVGTTFNFDGGASPSGDLGGTWATPSVNDDSHNHIYSNIDPFTEANLYTILSDVTQFYEPSDSMIITNINLTGIINQSGWYTCVNSTLSHITTQTLSKCLT